MALPPPRYELVSWPTGPQVSYGPPAEMLGWILSARNHTLRLERDLLNLQEDEDAYSFDDDTRLTRQGDTIVLGGPWGTDDAELPFKDFCAAVEDFLAWSRSQPAVDSNELFVMLADWLSGAITLTEVRRRDRFFEYDPLTGVELSLEETEQRLRALMEKYVGPAGAPETVEKLALALSHQIAVGQHDPRTGAFAIARLGPLVEERGTEPARLIRRFVELAEAAREAEGNALAVAELEHRIAVLRASIP